VTDITIKMSGLIVAAISVVSSGMQQLLCGVIQRKHKLQSYQLLANTAPVQGAMLILVGPYIDYLITGSNVMEYSWTTAAALVLAASCSVAVLVNISQVRRAGLRGRGPRRRRRMQVATGGSGAALRAAGPNHQPPLTPLTPTAPAPSPQNSSCASAASLR
jgi:hypothetical protein